MKRVQGIHEDCYYASETLNLQIKQVDWCFGKRRDVRLPENFRLCFTRATNTYHLSMQVLTSIVLYTRGFKK